MTDGNTCLRSIRSECPGGGSEPLNLKANKNMQVVRQSTELHPLRGWAWATSQPQLYVKVNSTESLPLSKSVTQTEDTELHVVQTVRLILVHTVNGTVEFQFLCSGICEAVFSLTSPINLFKNHILLILWYILES